MELKHLLPVAKRWSKYGTAAAMFPKYIAKTPTGLCYTNAQALVMSNALVDPRSPKAEYIEIDPRITRGQPLNGEYYPHVSRVVDRFKDSVSSATYLKVTIEKDFYDHVLKAFKITLSNHVRMRFDERGITVYETAGDREVPEPGYMQAHYFEPGPQTTPGHSFAVNAVYVLPLKPKVIYYPVVRGVSSLQFLGSYYKKFDNKYFAIIAPVAEGEKTKETIK